MRCHFRRYSCLVYCGSTVCTVQLTVSALPSGRLKFQKEDMPCLLNERLLNERLLNERETKTKRLTPVDSILAQDARRFDTQSGLTHIQNSPSVSV